MFDMQLSSPFNTPPVKNFSEFKYCDPDVMARLYDNDIDLVEVHVGTMCVGPYSPRFGYTLENSFMRDPVMANHINYIGGGTVGLLGAGLLLLDSELSAFEKECAADTTASIVLQIQEMVKE